MARNLNGKKQLDSLPPSPAPVVPDPQSKGQICHLYREYTASPEVPIPPLQTSLRLLGSVMFDPFAIAITYLPQFNPLIRGRIPTFIQDKITKKSKLAES